MCRRLLFRAGARLFSQNQQDSLTVRLRRRKVLCLQRQVVNAHFQLAMLFDSGCFQTSRLKNIPECEGKSMKKLQVCLVFSVMVLAVCASAQIQNGQFSGTVTDPSGAAIPNAKVTVTNTGTNLSVSTTTNQSGLYVAKELPVGTY